MNKLTRFFENHARVFKILVPTILIVLYTILCALNINSSIWFDESYSAYLIRGNFAEIWSMTAIDVHPPLFYFLLKIWSLIAGTSVVALRSMSVFFGIVSIVLLFRLLHRHFNLTVAIVGSFFFTLSPMFIRYGQEMRMYTVVIAFVIAATDVMLRALDTKDPKKSRRLWLFYAVLIALGMWTHYFTALAWIAQLIYILYRQGIFGKGGLKKFWQDKARRNIMLQTYGLAVACFIPWVPFFFKQTMSVQAGFWIGPVNLEALANFFSESLFYIAPRELKDWLLPLFVALLALIIFLSLRVFKKVDNTHRQNLIALLALIIVPPVVLILLSLPPFTPVYMTRYMIYSLALVWVFCGTVIAFSLTEKQSTPAIIAAILLAICGVVGIIEVTTREPNGYVGYTVQDFIDIAEPGEPLLVDNEWNYYDGIAYNSIEHPIVFYRDWSTYPYSSLQPILDYHYNVFDDLDAWLAEHDSFWAFSGSDDGSLRQELLKTHRIDQTISDNIYSIHHLVKK